MTKLAADRVARLAALGVALFSAGVGWGAEADVERRPAPSSSPSPAEADLEKNVIAPLKKQLDEMSAAGRQHADDVDHGEVQVIRPKITKEGFEKPKGWVIRVVHPFENDYFTTSYTAYELSGWEWADPKSEDAAVIGYDETLFVKNGDSIEALKKEPWLKMTTIPHRLRARRDGSSWQVSEIEAGLMPNKENLHKPVWMQ